MIWVLACEDCDYLTEYEHLNTGVTSCVKCGSTDLEVVECEDDD